MKKVVTNGCFDILHEGHLKLLKECAFIDGVRNHVTVLLNSDISIKKLKSYERPINNKEIRIEQLQKTGFVDEVILFENDDQLKELIYSIKPDYLVKGSDYLSKNVIGADLLNEWNGKLHFVNIIENYSTTIINELRNKHFLVTGGFGFIGSNLIKYLNKFGIKKISIIVDLENTTNEWKNIADCNFFQIIDYKIFEKAISSYIDKRFDYLINLGACSSTSETNLNNLWEKNTDYTNSLIDYCFRFTIPMIHASSAATYGMSDNFIERTEGIKPLNAYGFSKLASDKFLEQIIKKQSNTIAIYSLRFFNVYGPIENHKKSMISIISKFVKEEIELIKKDRQLEKYKKIKLERQYTPKFSSNKEFDKLLKDDKKHSFKAFKSEKKDVEHGEQKRDFIYVEDVCKIIFHFILNYYKIDAGIYNVGTGIATSINEVFKIINKNRDIEYIELPEHLKEIYQYYTEANITKLKNDARYQIPFITLEDGIAKCFEYYKNNV